MNKKTTITFETKIDDKTVELMARLPNLAQQREGQKDYNRAFNEAVDSDTMLRLKLDDFMKKQGIWDDEKQARMAELGKQIAGSEKALAKGGIKLLAAKDIAIKLRSLREDARELVAKRMELDVHTAEGQADNSRFNYWVSVCLVYNKTQKPVFSNVEDYLAKASEEYSALGASKLAELLYNLNSDFESTLSENKFLREFGFANDNNRLVNEDGHLVDTENHLIDEEGFFVSDKGTRVDIDGNPLDKDGNYDFVRKPFLDEKGKAIKKTTEKPAEVA